MTEQIGGHYGSRQLLSEGDTAVRVGKGERAFVIYDDYIPALEAELEKLRGEVPRQRAAAYRDAAALLEMQIKQLRREGVEIPSRLDMCVARLESLAEQQAEND